MVENGESTRWVFDAIRIHADSRSVEQLDVIYFDSNKSCNISHL